MWLQHYHTWEWRCYFGRLSSAQEVYLSIFGINATERRGHWWRCLEQEGLLPYWLYIIVQKKLFTSDKLGKKVTTKLLGSSHMPIIRWYAFFLGIERLCCWKFVVSMLHLHHAIDCDYHHLYNTQNITVSVSQIKNNIFTQFDSKCKSL
jgi:hypothetical protein